MLGQVLAWLRMEGLVCVSSHVCQNGWPATISALYSEGSVLLYWFRGSHKPHASATGTCCYSTGCLSNPCLGHLQAGCLQLHPCS